MQDLPELDNPAWRALTTEQASLAERSADGAAVRFPRDVSPFSAMDARTPAAWESLRELTGAGKAMLLMRAGEIEAPDGWERVFFEIGTQYVAVDPDPIPDLDVLQLGPDDVEEMTALTTLTEPGPFMARTRELGTYIGVRRDGQLVAMAGERFRGDTFTEISAVCVHPDARRQGLAAALTTVLAHQIREQGRTAMLHVRAGNEPADALYRRIGFEVRTPMTFAAFRCP